MQKIGLFHLFTEIQSSLDSQDQTGLIHFWPCLTKKKINKLIFLMNLYQYTKTSGYFMALTRGCNWFKNPVIWLAECILVYISWTRFFPNMGFAQEYNKQQKLFVIEQIVLFPYFPKSLTLTCTISHGFLAPCQNLQKSNDPIPRMQLDSLEDLWKDGRTYRLYFRGLLQLIPGVQ